MPNTSKTNPTEAVQLTQAQRLMVECCSEFLDAENGEKAVDLIERMQCYFFSNPDQSECVQSHLLDEMYSARLIKKLLIRLTMIGQMEQVII